MRPPHLTTNFALVPRVDALEFLLYVIKYYVRKNAYKSVKTALLLSNVTDADHQNSCLFTNKGHFSSPLWVLIGDLAKFHE